MKWPKIYNKRDVNSLSTVLIVQWVQQANISLLTLNSKHKMRRTVRFRGMEITRTLREWTDDTNIPHTNIKDKQNIQLLLLGCFCQSTHQELLERTISPALLQIMWPSYFSFPFPPQLKPWRVKKILFLGQIHA